MIHNCFCFYKPFVDTQLPQISQVVSWHTIALIFKLLFCKQTAFNFSQIVWWYKILFVFTSCWIDSSKFVYLSGIALRRTVSILRQTDGGKQKVTHHSQHGACKVQTAQNGKVAPFFLSEQNYQCNTAVGN